MTAVFEKVLEMSATASFVIIAVLIVRLLLSKAPKKYSYLLWSVVAFRLICPVSFRSAFSLLRVVKRPESVVSTVPPAPTTPAVPVIPIEPTVPDIVPPTNVPVDTITAAGTDWITVLAVIWCVGIAAMLVYAVISWFKVSRRLNNAVLLSENVWQSDKVRSPLIVGVLRPKIYIPFNLDEGALRYALAHERCHLSRFDHVVRPLAYLILALHWFNPLCWLAYFLMVKDMEMSCDEAVLKNDPDGQKAYSTLLLSFAVNKRFPTPNPLAFGETGVKKRIKNILNWKKPRLWATAAAIVVCLAVLVACAADPSEKKTEETPFLVLRSGEQSVAANWYPDGQFDFEYDELNTLSVSSRAELYFSPGFETDTLTVGEDYYKLYMGGTQIAKSTYELMPNDDGDFMLAFPERSAVKETTAIYYIPYGEGKFVVRAAFAPEKVQEEYVPDDEIVYTYSAPEYYGTTNLDDEIWAALQPPTDGITETRHIPMLVCNNRNMLKTLWKANTLDAESAKPDGGYIASYITDPAGLFKAMNVSGWETIFDQSIDRYIDQEGEALFTAEHTYELNFYSERLSLTFITGTDICGYKFIELETGRPTTSGVARIPAGTAEAVFEFVSPGIAYAEYVERPYGHGFLENAAVIYSGPGGGVVVNVIEEGTGVRVTEAAELNGELWLRVIMPNFKAPGNDEGWLLSTEVTEYTEDMASLVYSPILVPEGTEYYTCIYADEIPNTEAEISSYDRSGKIYAREGEYSLVACTGGEEIWVKSADIRPDIG